MEVGEARVAGEQEQQQQQATTTSSSDEREMSMAEQLSAPILPSQGESKPQPAPAPPAQLEQPAAPAAAAAPGEAGEASSTAGSDAFAYLPQAGWRDALNKPYQARERVRRIHLPVRPGMDELSDDEGDGSEWEIPVLKEGETLPPGYSGKRRKNNKNRPDGKIKPSYYYPTDSDSRGVPVFEPSYEEFRDFNSFITKIDNYGMRSGIVKIVPPKEWHDTLNPIKEPLKDTLIREPIEQHFMGSRGQFRQSNVASRRMFNVMQWKEMCDSDKYATPDFFNVDSKEETAEVDSPAQSTRQTRSGGAAKATASLRTKGKKPVKPKAGIEASSQVSEEDKSHVTQAESSNMEIDVQDMEKAEEWEKNLQSTPATQKTSSLAEDVLASPMRVVPPSPAETPIRETPEVKKPATERKRKAPIDWNDWDRDWDAFDWTTLPHGAKPEDFTPEECLKIEKTYWQRFTFGSPPMYGADGSGSLFDESVKDWNVACLDDLLMRINPHMPMPGVNTPYLYFGMWRATCGSPEAPNRNGKADVVSKVAWHVEDADLYSINYIHFGAPKFWYSVPQAHAERFERVMGSYFPHDQKKCHEFMRHKSFLISPTNLAKDNIPLNRCVQFPGEIILTYPYGYHSGFNLGFNCAESINFATEGWLDIGRKARPCVCQPDTVRINVDGWLEEARLDAERMRNDPVYAAYRKKQKEVSSLVPQHEAKKRRVMGSAAYDQLKRSLPAPPPNPLRSMQPVGDLDHDMPIVRAPTRPRPPRIPKPPVQSTAVPNGSFIPYANQRPKTMAPKAVVATAAPARVYPCALCPEMSQEGLVKIKDIKKGSKTLFAHKICVTFTPTTWCAPDPQTGEEVVHGFNMIEKERWNLKCGLCNDKHGTKIQCTKSSKCVRAYHATCALKENSGVILDATIGGISVLTASTDGAKPNFADGHLQLVITCRQHNPYWVKSQSDKRKEELAKRVATVMPGTNVHVRTSTGVWAVTLLAVNNGEGTIDIMFGDGQKGSCKFSAIVWPEDVQQQPVSAPIVKQPRVHPMERSKSSQTPTAQSQAPARIGTAPSPAQAPAPAQAPLSAPAAQSATVAFTQTMSANGLPPNESIQQMFASLTSEQQVAFQRWYIDTFMKKDGIEQVSTTSADATKAAAAAVASYPSPDSSHMHSPPIEGTSFPAPAA